MPSTAATTMTASISFLQFPNRRAASVASAISNKMNTAAARQCLTLGIYRPGASFSALLILLADATSTADGADKHALMC